MELDFIGWLTPRWKVLFRSLPDSFDGCEILDLGCGQGVLGFLLRHNYPDDDYKLTGFDGYEPYISALRKMTIYDWVYHATIDKVRGAFDYIFCLDVLEHNPKALSLVVLDRMISITSQKVFITVPHEEPLHLEKRRDAWEKHREASDNKYKGHRSTWSPEDFPFASVEVFDNRKDLSKSQRAFDTLRRKLLGVDWDEKHILAILDGDLDV